jgi:hypothetical protein
MMVGALDGRRPFFDMGKVLVWEIVRCLEI